MVTWKTEIRAVELVWPVPAPPTEGGLLLLQFKCATGESNIKWALVSRFN